MSEGDLTPPGVVREVVARLDEYVVVAERHQGTVDQAEFVVFVLCVNSPGFPPLDRPLPAPELSLVLGRFWTCGLLAGRRAGIAECQSLLAGVPVDRVRGSHDRMMVEAAELIDGTGDVAEAIRTASAGLLAACGSDLSRGSFATAVRASHLMGELLGKLAAYRRSFVDCGDPKKESGDVSSS